MDGPPVKRQKLETGDKPTRGRGRGRGRGRAERNEERPMKIEKIPREPDWWKKVCPEEILSLPLPEGVLPSEVDFGVTAYLDPSRPPFQAVFKQR